MHLERMELYDILVLISPLQARDLDILGVDKVVYCKGEMGRQVPTTQVVVSHFRR